MSAALSADIRVVWDAFYRSHYWVLSGTHSVLDGTVMAVPNDRRPFHKQAKDNLEALNERRAELGLPAIAIAGL